mgnify:FL=1
MEIIKFIFVCFYVLLLDRVNAQSIPSFPGAEGFGAQASGGRGGQVIYVTNLNASGAGSLNAALQVAGPRYILFKVSGVIPAAAEVLFGDVTIAGQTSPGGITVRGMIIDEVYEPEGTGDNIIIRHMRSRPHDVNLYPSSNYVLDDALRLDGANNTIADHCSFANAIDENVQISQSSNITIQNCSLAESIGGHYDLGGMLLNYSTQELPQDNISLHHNTWNRIGGRMPELSCESPYCSARKLNLELSDNLLWDPAINIWYNSSIDPGNENNSFFINLNWVNNQGFARNTFTNGLMSIDLLRFGGNNIYASGNKLNLYPSLSDYELFYCCNDFNEQDNHPNTDLGSANLLSSRHSFPSINYIPASELVNYMANNVGAFPRDQMDKRLNAPLVSGVIDPKPIDGTDYYNDAFIVNSNPPAAPIDSDNDGMPDYWENMHGLDPNVQDHNGLNLSISITDIEGYTNLECYLNCLASMLVSGQTSPSCGISLGLNNDKKSDLKVYPNPSDGQLLIESSEVNSRLIVRDLFGQIVLNRTINSKKDQFELGLINGIYIYQVVNSENKIDSGKLIIR